MTAALKRFMYVWQSDTGAEQQNFWGLSAEERGTFIVLCRRQGNGKPYRCDAHTQFIFAFFGVTISRVDIRSSHSRAVISVSSHRR
jgi:hypothetical protein